MKDILEWISQHRPEAMIGIGICLILLAWLKYEIKAHGVTLRPPSAVGPKIALSLLGLLLVAVPSYALLAHTDGYSADGHTVSYLFCTVNAIGTKDDCASGKCLLDYYVSGKLVATRGTATYRDRIKTSGRITKIRSVPREQILNPEQYPSNPTYLDYSISPPDPADKELLARVNTGIEKKLTPESGKIGLHFPYVTQNAVFVVNFGQMGFAPNRSLVAQIEQPLQDGVLQTGASAPILQEFEGGRVVMLVAHDIPKESSMILRWGD